MGRWLDRRDVPVIAVLVFVGVCILTLPTIASSHFDIGAIIGSAVGGVIGATGALLGVLLTDKKHRDRDDDRRHQEIRQTIRAIWQDVRATLRVVFADYEGWSDPYLLSESQKNLATEHLRPTVFDANLKRIGELDAKQALLLLLVHDNLRVVRERIGRFAFDREELPSDASDARLAEKQRTLYRILTEKRDEVDEIRDLLFSVCSDARAALSALDPSGRFEADLQAIFATRVPPDDDPGWLVRMEDVLREGAIAMGSNSIE